MADNKQNKYWTVKEENGLLNLLDPEKRLLVYVKWDGDIHVWFYETEVLFDHDTGINDLGYLSPDTKDNSDYYWIYDNIDEEIARLQSLKEIATNWFAKRGKRWPPDWEGYKGGLTPEQAFTIEPAKPETSDQQQQQAQPQGVSNNGR